VIGIRGLLEEGLDRGFFAGGAAAVSGPEGILVEEYAGSARLAPEREEKPATATTLWDLASLTKPLAGTALALGLARERVVSLEDPVGRYHDLWKRTRFAGVTLRRLLLHQGGLASWFPCYVRGEGRNAYAKTLSEVDPAGPPGREVVYSCLGFLLLAEALERAASATVDELFSARVSKPLGLEKDLLFAPEGADRERAAGGERNDGTERRRVADRKLRYVGFRSGVVNGQVNDGNAYRRAGGVSLNAGLFGTLRAVAEAGRAWLTVDGRILAEGDHADAVRNGTPEAGEHRGLGWQITTTPGSPGEPLSPAAYGHTGFTGVSLFVDPERRRVFVLLANRLHPDARAVDMNAFRRRFHELAKDL
jgi:CubicO group peptidase (beta-lactamase class C family)